MSLLLILKRRKQRISSQNAKLLAFRAPSGAMAFLLHSVRKNGGWKRANCAHRLSQRVFLLIPVYLILLNRNPCFCKLRSCRQREFFYSSTWRSITAPFWCSSIEFLQTGAQTIEQITVHERKLR